MSSYDSVDRVILEKTHLVCGRPINVQKAQVKDGSQRSGHMRSRPGSSFMPGSQNGQHYNDHSQNYFNDSFDSIPNNNYRGYGSNNNQGNDGSTPFGQEFVETSKVVFSKIIAFLGITKMVSRDQCDAETCPVVVVATRRTRAEVVLIATVVAIEMQVHRGLRGREQLDRLAETGDIRCEISVAFLSYFVNDHWQ